MPLNYKGLKQAVLVTGGREWTDYEAIRKVLQARDTRTVVIQGNARGADSLARKAAIALGMPHCDVPYFGRYQRGGGPIRNSFMLSILVGLKDQGWEVEVLAFHDNLAESKGTKNMVTQALDAGMEVKRYGHKKQA